MSFLEETLDEGESIDSPYRSGRSILSRPDSPEHVMSLLDFNPAPLLVPERSTEWSSGKW